MSVKGSDLFNANEMTPNGLEPRMLRNGLLACLIEVDLSTK